jgi:hypothetical protein
MTTTIGSETSFYPISLGDDDSVQFLVSATQPNPEGKRALMLKATIYFVHEYTAYQLRSGTDMSGMILGQAQRLLAHQPYDIAHDALDVMARLGITISDSEPDFRTYFRAYNRFSSMNI